MRRILSLAVLGLVASCSAREPAPRLVTRGESVAVATESTTCVLEPVVVEKAAAKPFAAAWPPSVDGGWMAWSDYRRSGEAGLPHAFARRFAPDTGDIWLGESQGPTAVLAGEDATLVARIDRDRRVAVHEIRDGAAHDVATLGRGGADPMLARSSDMVAIAWLESTKHPDAMISIRVGDGEPSRPLRVSEDPYAIRARLVGVPDGFVLVWTHYERSVAFARIAVDADGQPRIAWRTTLYSEGAGEWPAIDVEELGELGLVGDVLHVPLLKATCSFCVPDTHVLRVDLDGTVLPHVDLRAAPFFAAVVSEDGIALGSFDEETGEVCVDRFALEGRRLGPRSCIWSASSPETPRWGDGYAAVMAMRSSMAWRADELDIATLDNHDGTVFPTRRVFRCRVLG